MQNVLLDLHHLLSAIRLMHMHHKKNILMLKVIAIARKLLHKIILSSDNITQIELFIPSIATEVWITEAWIMLNHLFMTEAWIMLNIYCLNHLELGFC